MFERSKNIIFESRYGCYVLDDELVASKAADVEVKTLSTRKSGKEGSTADIICDSFLQLVLGMRLRTSADTQMENVEKLMDRLPPVEKNCNQCDLGPWLACDRGYGKKKVIQMLAEKNGKVITVTATAGSDHPIIPSSVVHSYQEKLKKQQNEDSEEEESLELGDSIGQYAANMLSTWTIEDNQDVLLGPEIKIARDDEISLICNCIS
jgi:hypothetical protein